MAAATEVTYSSVFRKAKGLPSDDEKANNSDLIGDQQISLDISSIPPRFVLVGIKASGLNPIDRILQDGGFGEQYFDPAGAISKEGKTVLGHDFAGVIESIGSDVKEFKEGDAVFGMITGVGKYSSNGSFASKVLIHENLIAKIPDNLDESVNSKFIQMASAGVCGLTAYEMLIKSQLELRAKSAITMNQNGPSVLITGASGGVGSFITGMVLNVLQSNKNVFVTAGSDKSINYCVDTLGILKENIINYKEFDGDVDKMVEQVKKLNGGKLIDVTYDNVGGLMKLLCAKSLRVRGGMTTIVGEDANQSEAMINFAKAMFSFGDPVNSLILYKSASLHCIFELSPALVGDEDDTAFYQNDLKQVAQIMSNIDTNRTFNFKLPEITLYKGMNADNLCQAMIKLSKGIQGKIVITIE